MKILHINTVPTERNGITNVIFNLLRAIDKAELDIDLLAINQPEPCCSEEINAYGGRLYTLPRSIRHPLRYVRRLKALIKENQYDIVHVHGNSSTLTLEMLAAKAGGCKVRMAHSHNTTCKHQALHRFLKPLFYSSYTHALACGNEAGRWLFKNRDFKVIHNGINTQRFAFSDADRQRLRQKYTLPKTIILLGHVGTFSEQKNHTFLIDVMKELLSQSDRYYLLLLGEGELQPEIAAKVKQLGLEKHVIFAGVTDNVPAYLSACDIIVMPSLYEGLPLSLIEEQANGLPCIVSDRITQEADKTGSITFLPLEDGAAAWASVIKKTELPSDRQQASEDAVQKIVACGYSIEEEAAKLKRYYTEALENT